MKVYTGAVLIFCVVLELAGLAIFLKGFFPLKHSVSGHSVKELPTEPVWEGLEQATDAAEYLEPTYDRLVVVLIDALRADFVLPGGSTELPRMKFVEKMIRENRTLSYMAKAHPPTVTMPRIKALTTGGIPGFIDVVLNFDSKDLSEDSVISQLHRHGKKIVFYGDDTWIRLFPGHFLRTEGTTSFFVTDYTEVDNNVTRHLDTELNQEDWEVMILHYLGLDHIGHLAGPWSPLVGPKLNEMDDIIQTIYRRIVQKDRDLRQKTLLMLCGDHGMTDQGGHGGSSRTETSTPLVLMSSVISEGIKQGRAYTGQSLDQTDAAPTLSVLFGVPIPQNSLGAVMPDVLGGLTPRDRLRAAYINARQLLRVLQENTADYENERSYLMYKRAVDSHVSWLQTLRQDPGSPILEVLTDRVLDLYYDALTSMRERVAGTLAAYDLHAMGAGTVMLWAVILMLLMLLPGAGETVDVRVTVTNLLVLFLFATLLTFTQISICTSAYASDVLCSLQVAAVVPQAAVIIFTSAVLSLVSFGALRICASAVSKMLQCCPLLNVFLLGSVMHTISLLSSSFVEEEHQTWYFFTVSAHILYAMVTMSTTWVKGHPEYQEQQENSNEDELVASNELYKEKNTKTSQKRSRNRTNGRSVLDRVAASGGVSDIQRSNPYEWINSSLLTGVMLLLCRVARTWNQTGDKWAHLPDVGDWLVRPENKVVLSGLTVCCLCLAGLLVYARTRSRTTTGLFVLGACGVYSFRCANGALSDLTFRGNAVTKGVTEARVVYTVVALLLFHAIYKFRSKNKQNYITEETRHGETQQTSSSRPTTNERRSTAGKLHHVWLDVQVAWMLLALLLLRPQNSALATLVFYQESLMSLTQTVSVPSLAILYYWMGQASFFYQGNSNSISTVDVSAGYVGLNDYNPVLIGLLMCLSTYVFPIYWSIALVTRIMGKAEVEVWDFKRLRHSLCQCAVILCLSRALPLGVYVILVTTQRYHLFVWTVFSPKLLYEGMHWLVVAVETCVLVVQATVLRGMTEARS